MTGSFSGANNSHSENSEISSVRERVFRELDKNPSLTSKPLCKLLGLDYQAYHRYVDNLRNSWKSHYRNERGLKCSTHAWRGWCYLPSGLGVVRARAVDVGWKPSRARNRWLLWKDRLGRLQWFETGRINLYVRRPANLGRAYQLICNAFSFTGLVTDMKVLQEILSGLRFKGANYVVPIGQRLPKFTIDLFQKFNGIVIKVGDESHPDSLEVLATYPDRAERNERLFEQINESLKNMVGLGPRNLSRGDDYVS